MDISETISDSGLKICRCKQIIYLMKASIEGQGHFLTLYFPGFVCIVLILDPDIR